MDNSGKIDSYEFICALALISHATLQEKSAAIFRLYDFDNSLVLNFDEMVVLIRCCLCSLAAMCGRRDIPSIQSVEEKVDQLFNRHDKDSDGQISLDEFQSLITKDKEILQTLKDFGLLKSYDLRDNFGYDDELPECDSDLENEENKGLEDSEIEVSEKYKGSLHVDKSELIDRMRQGIEFATVEQDNQIFEFQAPPEAEQRMAIQPWKNVIKYGRPSEYQSDSTEGTIPDADLELEYVYGYRCHDTRNNISYAPSGDLIYHTAALGIVMNKKTNTQKFFFGHYDDITCLTTFDNLVATGQVGKKPIIAIWDCKNCNSLGTINNPLKRGISHLAFSSDGKKLAAVSVDKYHSTAIFDVSKILSSKGEVQQPDCILAYNRGPSDSIFHICFDGTGNSLAFGCKRGIYFGSIKSRAIKLKRGRKWTPNCPKQAVLCLTSIDQNIVGGTHSGQLVIFKDNDLISDKSAHKSACTAICKRKNGKGFITGGNDGIIITWDSNFNKVFEISLLKDLTTTKFQSMNTKIRAITEDMNQDITIGTRGGELIEIKKDASFGILNRGHFNKELWGLCHLKKREEFITVGEDSMLAIFNMNKRKMSSSTKLMFKARCIDCDPNGKRLAVGCKNGYVLILDISTF